MTPVGEILLSLMDGVRDGVSLPELLCQDACRRLPISAAGIALMNDAGGVDLAVASDERAAELEGLQTMLGEGPCVDAHMTGRLVLHSDLAAAAADRWPAYTPAVLELGVRAIFAYPLRVGGIRLGVLDLYRDERGLLTDADLGTALNYVDAAVMIVLHLQASDRLPHDRAPDESAAGPLEIAFRGHPEVHQATGMISIQAGVGLAEALLLLRAYAFAEGRDVSAVAADVVARKFSFN